MTVQELIEALSELPQGVEVFALKPESLDAVTKVYATVPGNKETEEVTGKKFVVIE